MRLWLQFRHSRSSARYLSIGNMFSGGIFLGGGLMHLLPEANNNYVTAMATIDSDSWPEAMRDFPVAFFLCGLGFFAVLIVYVSLFAGCSDTDSDRSGSGHDAAAAAAIAAAAEPPAARTARVLPFSAFPSASASASAFAPATTPTARRIQPRTQPLIPTTIQLTAPPPFYREESALAWTANKQRRLREQKKKDDAAAAAAAVATSNTANTTTTAATTAVTAAGGSNNHSAPSASTPTNGPTTAGTMSRPLLPAADPFGYGSGHDHGHGHAHSHGGDDGAPGHAHAHSAPIATDADVAAEQAERKLMKRVIHGLAPRASLRSDDSTPPASPRLSGQRGGRRLPAAPLGGGSGSGANDDDRGDESEPEISIGAGAPDSEAKLQTTDTASDSTTPSVPIHATGSAADLRNVVQSAPSDDSKLPASTTATTTTAAGAAADHEHGHGHGHGEDHDHFALDPAVSSSVVAYILGLLLSETLAGNTLNLVSSCFQGFSSGTFLFVALGEIIPKELATGRDKGWKLALCLLGFVGMSAVKFSDRD